MVFKVTDIPEMKGVVAIITGANTGIGRITAFEIAKKGGHVILACRNKEKTDPVVQEIRKETGNEKVEFVELDLSSLDSITKFSEEIHSKEIPLNLLVNNAGIMACPFSLTKDGIESQFGTNHVGHFYLTNLLYDILEKNQPSRIVNVSSLAHNFTVSGGIGFDSINKKEGYSEWPKYGQSKLANILFTDELAKRGKEKGNENIFVNSVHPGAIPGTDLLRHQQEGAGFLKSAFLGFYTKFFGLTVEDGALTQLYVATHPDIVEKKISGHYFVPIAKDSPSSRSSYAKDEELKKKLWEFTVEMIREKKPDFKPAV